MYSTIFSRIIFPTIELVLRRHILSTVAEYDSLQYEPYERLKARQEARLRPLLRHAFENVPFYGALNAFIPVLAHSQGYRITEVKVEQVPGWFDKSYYPKNYIRRVLDLISVVFLSRISSL